MNLQTKNPPSGAARWAKDKTNDCRNFTANHPKKPAFAIKLNESIVNGYQPKTVNIFLNWELYRAIALPDYCAKLVAPESGTVYDLSVCRGYPTIVHAEPAEIENKRAVGLASLAAQCGASGVAITVHEDTEDGFTFCAHRGIFGVFDCEAQP